MNDVMRKSFYALLMAHCAIAVSYASFDTGVALYKERRWTEAMEQFLDTLQNDPKNKQAHRYIDAIAIELRLEQEKKTEDQRVAYMRGAGFAETRTMEEQRQQTRWQNWLGEARMHRDLGHLLPANDLVLRLLMESPGHTEALRELSELQARLRRAIDQGTNLVMEERFACEGFYAYGQADYAGALQAWNKARQIVQQNSGRLDQERRLATLHFARYEMHARDVLSIDQKKKELETAFAQALSLYQRERYDEALDAFRRLAIREPEYPQLAYYLVQSESGAEKNRARRLGEQKRRQIEILFADAMTHLEAERYALAEASFSKLLTIDPSHSRAQSYLALARAENQRRHDPKAAQQHYESGLVAYASGKLDDAQREWTLTLRMNASHEKARVALAKVQKELAMSRDDRP